VDNASRVCNIEEFRRSGEKTWDCEPALTGCGPTLTGKCSELEEVIGIEVEVVGIGVGVVGIGVEVMGTGIDVVGTGEVGGACVEVIEGVEEVGMIDDSVGKLG